MCPCVAFRARWVVSWLTLIADRLDLDRYVSITFYGVCVYCAFSSPFLEAVTFHITELSRAL